MDIVATGGSNPFEWNVRIMSVLTPRRKGCPNDSPVVTGTLKNVLSGENDIRKVNLTKHVRRQIDEIQMIKHL